MSNLPATVDQAPAAAQPGQAPAPYDPAEAEYLQLLRRMQRTVPTIVRMPGLNKSLVVTSGRGENKQVDWDATRANVEVIGFTLADYGIALNATNVQQWDLIQGTLQPRCQMQMGIVTSLTGHSISLAVNDEDRAVAVLVRADTGERHTSTYTIDMARRSGALDVWVEKWNDGAKRYDKVVLGTSEDEAKAAQKTHPESWVRTAGLKMNEAWHRYTADMLARRALKRVMRFGAPEVVSGSVGPRPHTPPPEVVAKSTVAQVDLDVVDEDEDRDVAAMGDRPALPAYRWQQEAEAETDAAFDHIIETTVREFVTRLRRLWRQVEAIPQDWQRPLCLALDAKGIPTLYGEDFMPRHIDAAERIVDTITAQALAGGPVAGAPDGVKGTGGVQQPDGTDAAPPVSTKKGREDSAASGHTTSPTEPARPLAQQIAMQAKAAGVDHHHVMAALCVGKASAKDLTAAEGRTVLESIADIAAGRVVLGQVDGTWVLDAPEAEQQTFAPDDPSRPFTD